MLQKRRRGTAIVETSKGILLVAGKSGIFILPGGGTKYNEGMLESAVRELREETTLRAYNAKYLFDYVGRIHRSKYGGQFQDYHNVFLMRANGIPTPSKEIKEIAYHSEDMSLHNSELRLSKTTIEIIERYYQYKNMLSGGGNFKPQRQRIHQDVSNESSSLQSEYSFSDNSFDEKPNL